MRPTLHVLLCMAVLHAAVLHGAAAANITKILSQFPEYSTFNDYLSQTQLAPDINSRSTITVLVVKNGAMASLIGQNFQLSVIKNVLRLHVLLDYFDKSDIAGKVNGSTLSTTLYQTTGQAGGESGSMNVTEVNGKFLFGQPGTPASQMATLVKEVKADPYNMSVLEISQLVMPDDVVRAPPAPPQSSPPPSPAADSPDSSPPAEAPGDAAPAGSPRSSPSDEAPKASPPAPPPPKGKGRGKGESPKPSPPSPGETVAPSAEISPSPADDDSSKSAASRGCGFGFAWPAFAVVVAALVL